jgi:c-di-GMP-related signal transduction protein
LFQGYYFGKPKRASQMSSDPNDDLEGLLETIDVSADDVAFVEKVNRASVSLAH